VRADQEERELVPVAVPEPPADLLEEMAGVLDFHRPAYGRGCGGGTGGGGVAGAGALARVEGPGRRVHRTKRAARLASAAARAPVAAAAMVTTATDAESCQWRKRTVTESGFWKAKIATVNIRIATIASRTCID
jgi:hypothetical protein